MKTFDPLKARYAKNMQWWMEDRTDVHNAVFDTVESLRDNQGYIEDRAKEAISLYENVDVENLDAWRFMTTRGIDGPYQYNLVESVTDTVHADIIANKTKPQFLTTNGDWLASEDADSLTEYVSAIFEDKRVYKTIAPQVCLDALVFGTGVIKGYVTHEEDICLERIHPFDIIVDDVEAAGGYPKQVFQVSKIPRQVLEAMFCEDKNAVIAIRDAQEFEFQYGFNSGLADMIEVFEAWRLPTSSQKGRHVICIKDATLVDEEWGQKTFPFVFLRYKERTKGFWGKGIPEMLEGHQTVINDLREKINQQIQNAAPFIWVKPGSQLKEAELSNEIFRVVEADEMPQYIVYNSVPEDLFRQMQQEVADAASLVGVNTLMLKNELPPGINSGSGRALRIFNDTKSKRFMRFARAYENMFLDLADLCIDLSNEALGAGINIEVQGRKDLGLEPLKYGEIKIDKKNLRIRVSPVSFLSDSPTGRLSDIEALAGVFPEDFKPYLVRLMNNPDLDRVTSLVSADTDATQKACSAMLRGKKTAGEVPPNEYMDLNEAMTVARAILLDAMTRGAPDERVQEVISWLEMAKEIQRQQEQQQIADQMEMQQMMNPQLMPQEQGLPQQTVPDEGLVEA